MARDNVPLAEAAARVLLSCVPALDSDSIFSVSLLLLLLSFVIIILKRGALLSLIVLGGFG